MSRAARPYHHGDLRKAFLAEAAKIVEVEGVAALTIREIARRLGVSHAASANHFADKNALLSELAADGFEELAAELAAVTGTTSPVARLRETGRAYVRFALRRPGHFRVMFGPKSPGKKSSRLTDEGAKAYALLEQAVVAVMPAARARSAERVHEAAFLAWSVVHGAATLLLDGPLSPHMLPSPNDVAARSALVERATAVVARAISGAGWR